MDLNNVDKELHDAYATRDENIEVRFLHGYPMMLWTNNARRALEMRQSRLVATNVAMEIVNDIMDWMLEGWYFGERESGFSVAGYVPSIKGTGMIKAGQDQLAAMRPALAKQKARYDAAKAGVVLDTAATGTRHEKAMAVEKESQIKQVPSPPPYHITNVLEGVSLRTRSDPRDPARSRAILGFSFCLRTVS